MGVEIGVLAVRRSVLIKATPERVWQEFETLEKMRAWFGLGHTLHKYEPRLGGQVELSMMIDGDLHHYGGRIIVFEAAREVTFEDDYMPNEGWLAPTMITIRLRPELGGTLVELFHHAFERVGPAMAEEHLGYEGGWTTNHLEALKGIVEG